MEKLQAHTTLEGMVIFITFISRPYSRSEPVGEYKSVLVVTSSFGIAGVILYIK
jgi:hypothetical protein